MALITNTSDMPLAVLVKLACGRGDDTTIQPGQSIIADLVDQAPYASWLSLGMLTITDPQS